MRIDTAGYLEQADSVSFRHSIVPAQDGNYWFDSSRRHPLDSITVFMSVRYLAYLGKLSGANMQDTLWVLQLNSFEGWGTGSETPGIADMLPTADGGILLVGSQRNIKDPQEISPSEAGWLCKFSANGEKEWERTYMPKFNPFENFYTGSVLMKAVATPDGGYAACGECSYYDVIEEKISADVWLLKVDAQGCLEDWSCESEYLYLGGEAIDIESVEQAQLLSIAPNPATDKLFIHSPETLTNVAIYNTLGQQFPLLEGARGSTNSPSERGSGAVNEAQKGVNELSVAHLPPGIYLLRAHTQSGKVMTHKFVKR
ncbi:MAG: T9SS type A sorting domain-containing protein [Sphingobacteriales bacterium]|nr:T9SS type A sorting domain-containing protein [Sphingobacteriales bacterium]